MLLKHIWKISKTPYNPSKRVPVPTICHFSISSYVQSYSTTVQNPHACLKFRNTILCICSFILAGSRQKKPAKSSESDRIRIHNTGANCTGVYVLRFNFLFGFEKGLNQFFVGLVVDNKYRQLGQLLCIAVSNVDTQVAPGPVTATGCAERRTFSPCRVTHRRNYSALISGNNYRYYSPITDIFFIVEV